MDYTFEIEGSENYQVAVQLNDFGDIVYSECDCPYDFGPICKHEVAAYYELAELMDKKEANPQKVTEKQKDLKNVFRK